MVDGINDFKSFDLEPGRDLDVELGFMARSLVLDNPTGQWWYVQHINRYIGPWTLGTQFTFPGTQRGRILAQTPARFASNAESSEVAKATWYAEPRGDVSPISIDPNISQLLATLTLSQFGLPEVIMNIDVPTQTTHLGIIVDDISGGINFDVLQIRGVQSQMDYLMQRSGFTEVTSHRAVVPFYRHIDNQVSIQARQLTAGTHFAKIRLFAYFGGISASPIRVEQQSTLFSDAIISTGFDVPLIATQIVGVALTRRLLILCNDSDEVIYLGLDSTAALGEGIRLNANGGTIWFAGATAWGYSVNGICAIGPTARITITSLE